MYFLGNCMYFLENLTFLDAGDNGGIQDPTPTTEEQHFKSFEKEEDFNNFVKSERSKAKKEVLDELNVKNLNEAKEGLSAYATLQNEYSELQKNHNKLNEDFLVHKMGIKEEHKEDALILAKAKIGEGVTLEDSLKTVAESMPFLAGGSYSGGAGSERGKGKIADDTTDKLAEKYPWLKKK